MGGGWLTAILNLLGMGGGPADEPTPPAVPRFVFRLPVARRADFALPAIRRRAFGLPITRRREF